MAFSPFDRGREGEGRTAPVPAASGAGALTAFMDRGSQFEGTLSFKDTVRIDGSFRGEIKSENTLIVGETGEVEATIRSQTIVVSGSVEGDVFAGRQLVLQKTGRLHGAVETPSLIVEEGALLDGPVKMIQVAKPAANGKNETKATGPDAAKADASKAKGAPSTPTRS